MKRHAWQVRTVARLEPFFGLLPCYANTVKAFSLRVALFNDVSQCQAFTLRYVSMFSFLLASIS